MSAISAFTRDGVAYLLADAGAFEEDGRLGRCLTKIAVSNRLGMAVGFNGVGSEETVEAIESWLNQVETQALMLANMHRLVGCLEEINVRDEAISLVCGTAVQLFVAAWVDAAPVIFVVGSATSTYPQSLSKVSSVRSPPIPDILLPVEGFRPVHHGQAILEYQRRTSRHTKGGYRVGGWGELVSVDAHRVSRKRIVEWPDMEGRPITDPLAPGRRLAAEPTSAVRKAAEQHPGSSFPTASTTQR